jgi:hypothetical protein
MTKDRFIVFFAAQIPSKLLASELAIVYFVIRVSQVILETILAFIFTSVSSCEAIYKLL